MKITTTRRITQIVFFIIFLWFCIVTVWGTKWHELRGWPINWILELDPLVGIGTLLATHTLYKGLAWGFLTLGLTVIFGRFFCGWICPFGAMHQFIGYLGSRLKNIRQRVESNQYHWAQGIKYYLLVVFLLMAAIPLGNSVYLATGLLDPIPFVHRAVNLILLSIASHLHLSMISAPRYYEGAASIGLLFLAALLVNLWVPRFYCRYLCPAGALMSVFSKFAIWRIGKTDANCAECELCENHCEGACDPFGKIRISECLLCMNCIHSCNQQKMAYQKEKSSSGEITEPDVTRRGLILSGILGVTAVPVMRVGATLGQNWNPGVIRPPGALAEAEFLKRCLKCGQCMKICPTNIIMPGGAEAGFESLWTPTLNFRIGTSGCQLNCVACGHACPTAAIRPLTLEEKLGKGSYQKRGPIRMGTAFVDTTRCLPWSMNTPCIVCQENCPVTPKAIYISESYATVRNGKVTIKGYENGTLSFQGRYIKSEAYSGGDYYLEYNQEYYRIISNTESSLTLETGKLPEFKKDTLAEIKVHLLAPVVDIEKCIGCGVCEHECPVSGLRAIRVTAENETREMQHSLFLKRG